MQCRFLSVVLLCEIGSVPILRGFVQFNKYEVIIIWQLFVPFFPVSDNILKNHAHIRNKHIWNRLCAK